MFDIEAYITERLDHEYDGDHIKIDCLDPSCDDSWKKGKHLWFSLKRKRGYCFKCSQGWGPTKIVQYNEDIEWKEAQAFVEKKAGISKKIRTAQNRAAAAMEEYFRQREAMHKEERDCRELKIPQISLPPCGPIEPGSPAEIYLASRGFGRDVIDRFRLLYASAGPFGGRLIIPIYYQRQLVGYQGRDITGQQEPKYLFPFKHQIGDRVKVVTGEFAGSEGTVLRYGERYSVVVQLDDGILPQAFKSKELDNLSKESRGASFANFLYNYESAVQYMKAKAINEILVVEGVTDLWYVWSKGYRNVVGTFGKSLKEWQRRFLLDDPQIELITNFWDGEAEHAKLKFAEDLCRFKRVRIVELEHGEEPDGLADIDSRIANAVCWNDLSRFERLNMKRKSEAALEARKRAISSEAT